MTLIAGYIYSDSIQLIADSAESYYGEPKGNISSFGESDILSDDYTVEESAQKLYSFNDQIILTYSGNVNEGTRTLKDLQDLFNQCELNNLLVELNNYFKNNLPENTDYIIAFIAEDKPILFYYKDQKCHSTFKHLEGIILGSGAMEDNLTKPFELTLSLLSQKRVQKDICFHFNISILQCAALNAITYKDGVGGFMNGVMISNKGVKWAEDTSYVIYSSFNFDKGERFIVNKYNRDGAVFITSPHTEKKALFPESFWSKIIVEEWTNNWIEDLLQKNSNCDAEYYSFICYDRRIVTIVDKKRGRFQDYIRIDKLDDEKIDFQLKGELIQKMLTYPVNPETGNEDSDGFGVQLNYL